MKMIFCNGFKTCFKLVLALSLFVGLVGCSSLNGAPSGMGPDKIPDAVPKAQPRSKYGNAKSYTVKGKRYSVLSDAEAKTYDKHGKASWYGNRFHGQRTSTLDPYNMYDMTAASTELPIPCFVRVTNLKNGRSAIVKVNDRGPFVSDKRRIIDLSYVAAKKLGYTAQGTTDVRVTAIDVSSIPPLLAKNDAAIPRLAKSAAKNNTQMSVRSVLTSMRPVQLAANDSKMYLQVGAFSTHNSAENVSKKIAKLTKLNRAQVEVKKSVSDGSSVYKVHIGPLKDGKSMQVAKVLAANGFDFESVMPLAG